MCIVHDIIIIYFLILFAKFAAVTGIDTSGLAMIKELKKMLEKRSLQVSFRLLFLIGVSFDPFSRPIQS